NFPWRVSIRTQTTSPLRPREPDLRQSGRCKRADVKAASLAPPLRDNALRARCICAPCPIGGVERSETRSGYPVLSGDVLVPGDTHATAGSNRTCDRPARNRLVPPATER